MFANGNYFDYTITYYKIACMYTHSQTNTPLLIIS